MFTCSFQHASAFHGVTALYGIYKNDEEETYTDKINI